MTYSPIVYWQREVNKMSDQCNEEREARIETLTKAARDAVHGYENFVETGSEELLAESMIALAARLYE